jgi:hypothetical protein
VRTVEVHRARVFDKMEVKSAVELANPGAGGGADCDAQPAMNINAAAAAAPETRSFLMRFPSNGPLKKR